MANIVEILEERGKEYGPFIDHATVTQEFKSIARQYIRKPELMGSDHWEALDMIFHKIGRILNGNPQNIDSWADIAGYAKLVADRLGGVVR